ncbi:hypothetical protein RB595_008254 [Gaeumannomyces hyphopodioides]
MKFSSSLSIVAASVAAFAGAAAAQDCVATALKVIPQCAQSCFLNGAPAIGCAGTDFQCQCKSQPQLMAAVEGCVQKACPTASYQAVIDGGAKVCECAAGLATAAAQGSNTVGPSNTVAPSNTVIPTGTKPSTTKPTTVPTAAANRPSVGMAKEMGILAGVFGTTLFAALAL